MSDISTQTTNPNQPTCEQNFDRFLQVALVDTEAAASIDAAKSRQEFEIRVGEGYHNLVSVAVESPFYMGAPLRTAPEHGKPWLESGHQAEKHVPILRFKEGSVEAYAKLARTIDQAGVQFHIRFATGRYPDGSERNDADTRARTAKAIFDQCSSNVSIAVEQVEGVDFDPSGQNTSS